MERHQCLTAYQRANESSRRAKRALKVLTECNELLVRATDEQRFLNDVCQIPLNGGYRMAWIGYACQDESRTVQPQAAAGFENGYLQSVKITWSDNDTGRSATGTAIRTGTAKVNRNTLTNPEYDPWRCEALTRGYVSSIALPLCDHEEIFGALTMYSEEPDAFDDEEMDLLRQLADDISYGICTLRMRAEKDKADLALRETEHRYRTLFEESRDGVYSLLKNGIMTDANPSLRNLLVTRERRSSERTFVIFSLILPTFQDSRRK